MKNTESSNSKSNKQSTGIDSIVSAPVPPPTEKGWVTVLQKFNPLGAAAEAYGRTLAYRLECKRIDAELERVRTQAAVVHDAIDKSFQLSMEDLTQRRLSINRFFDTVQGELGQHHLERMTVLKMAERATEHMLSPGLSIEERRNCKELAAELTAQIPIFGDKANQSLQTLLNALPQVKLPDQLLLPS
ncbi:MAG: hypothetical protein HOP24_01530 [Sideroxydans sp.]|nr:hypothetical protein [Sideroxydans sp.]